MNKMFKIFFLLTGIFLFSMKINAANTYTFACDYTITSSEGKPIQIRIKVNDLPEGDIGWSASSSNMRRYVLSSTGNGYEQISTACKNDGYKNAPATNSKLCILTESGDGNSYLQEAMKSGKPNCPTLYQRGNYTKGISLTIASKLSNSSNNKQVATRGLVCYDASGNSNYCSEVTPKQTSSGGANAYGNGGTSDNPGGQISERVTDCESLLGPNITKLVRLFANVVRVVGAIAAVINASLAVVPAISNPDKMQVAKSKCTTMAILLVVILLFKPLLFLIRDIFQFDATCFI